MAVKWSQVSKGQQALDVCCGSGDLAFRLAEAVGPSGQVKLAKCPSSDQCQIMLTACIDKSRVTPATAGSGA